MKKLFLTAVSLAAAVSCIICSRTIIGYAEILNNVTGVFDVENVEEFIFSDADEINLNISNMPDILSNKNDGAYNYGNFLDENNRAVYDALSVWASPSLDTVTAELPETVKITISALPGSSSYTEEDDEIFSSAIFSNCKPGIDSLFFDLPEIFWLDTSILSIGVGNATYSYNRRTGNYTFNINSLKFTPAILESYDTLETAELYKEKLESAIEYFNVSGDTRYNMIKSIHDTIALFTYYDLNANFSSSAVGALVEPGVVCEGYSKGLKLICDKMDIPCVLVFGNYNKETDIAHMWNYIQMEDGLWYAIDLTWDDTDGEYGSEMDYDYFLTGSDEFFINHTEESDYLGTIFTYPKISSDNYVPVQTESSTTTNTETTTTETTTTTTTTTTITTLTEASSSEATTSTTVLETSSTETATSTTVSETSSTETATSTTVLETTTITTTESISHLQGDFNHDGKVNSVDLVLCAQSVIGRKTAYFCDFDEDGIVDIFDLLFMRKYIAGIMK